MAPQESIAVSPAGFPNNPWAPSTVTNLDSPGKYARETTAKKATRNNIFFI